MASGSSAIGFFQHWWVSALQWWNVGAAVGAAVGDDVGEDVGAVGALVGEPSKTGV